MPLVDTPPFLKVFCGQVEQLHAFRRPIVTTLRLGHGLEPMWHPHRGPATVPGLRECGPLNRRSPMFLGRGVRAPLSTLSLRPLGRSALRPTLLCPRLGSLVVGRDDDTGHRLGRFITGSERRAGGRPGPPRSRSRGWTGGGTMTTADTWQRARRERLLWRY